MLFPNLHTRNIDPMNPKLKEKPDTTLFENFSQKLLTFFKFFIFSSQSEAPCNEKNKNLSAWMAVPAVFFALTAPTHAQTLTFYTIAQQFTPQTLDEITYSGSGTPTVSVVGDIDPSSTGTRLFSYGGLAWDSANSTLYMINGQATSPAQLYTINTTTGAATLVGNTGASDLYGMTYDSQNGEFYAYDGDGSGSAGLYEISPTGATTLVAHNTTEINGLAYNPTLNEIIGSVPNGALYAINVSNGNLTELAAGSGAQDDNGMAYDPTGGNYYGIDNSRNFYEVGGTTYGDTNISTSILEIGASNPRPDGLALVTPEPGSLSLTVTGVLTAAGLTLASRRRQAAAR